jgi:nitrous oxidase accessory protein
MLRLCLFLMLLSSQLVIARTLTVGRQAAYKSIRAALAAAQAFDTLKIQPGTYREGNLEITQPLVLWGINYPVLDGQLKYEILSIKANNVCVLGLRLVNSGYASIQDIAGIRVYGVNEVSIQDNVLENTFFGIYLTNASNCRIWRNRLRASERAQYNIGNGIHLWKCQQASIVGNHIARHRDGIYFEFVTNSLIKNNLSEINLRYGLHFMFSHNDRYEHNTFRNNGAGVAVMYTQHVTMLRNHFDENWGDSAYGLLLKDIRDSHIEHNSFRKNTIGIYMEGTSRSQFVHNDFIENGYALRLQASCDDNTFERNNFAGNTFDVATNGTMVLNTLRQNYWDKYEGYDLQHDGVGDVPYRPVSLYATILERIPQAVMLLHSFAVTLMDKIEKIIPSLTPENLKDPTPLIRPVRHDTH